MNFSENLTRTRKSLGMSQEDLAGRIGVSRQAVSKWETGDAAPDLIKLLALAPQAFDAVCVGGVCSGSACLSEYDTYTVSVVVSDGAGSRAAAVARDLHFREGSASWVPLSETS